MNKIFFAGLMSALVLVSGCYGEETPTNQSNTPPVENSVQNGTENGQNKPADADENNSPQKPETVSGDNEKVDDGKSTANPPASNEPHDEKSTDSPQNNRDPESHDTNEPSGQETVTPVSQNPKQSGEVSQPENPKPTPPTSADENQGNDSSIFGDNNLVMTGILVALGVMALILVWLIFDRRKMKKTLDDLNKPATNTVDVPIQINNEPQSTLVVQTPSVAPLTLRVGNLQNIGRRKEQQDSFCVSDITDKIAVKEKGVLAVVADGMGGLQGGANISNLVAETFLDSYKSQSNFEPTFFLYQTAEAAERAVEQYMQRTGVNGGSTLVAVMVKNSQLNYISVGDSHIYLLRDNVLTLMNQEHNFAAVLREKAKRGEVDENEQYVNPKRNALTAYIGIGNFDTVDRNSRPEFLRAGDKILLCSDGVYNALGNDAIIAALSFDAITAAKRLEHDILAQNIPEQDNFTAIILECM